MDPTSGPTSPSVRSPVYEESAEELKRRKEIEERLEKQKRKREEKDAKARKKKKLQFV